MGILNVTPDSFSDGGKYLEFEDAVARAGAMIAEGASIIDIGGESTRPGAQPVPPSEQIARTIPIIESIRKSDDQVAISTDTRLATVARAALDAGADIVNDVSALRDDPAMVDVIADTGASVVLMHRRGTSTDMQRSGGPQYDDVVSEIAAFLEERKQYGVSRGIDPTRILFDPGIGFGKRVEHNLEILGNLDRFIAMGQPLLVGASRKSFIGKVLGLDDPSDRESGSLACVVMAALAGAAVIRVHDVRPAVEAVRLCQAVRNAKE